MRYGFTPGYQDSFFHEYTRPQWQVLQDQCGMVLHTEDNDFQWTLGRDYFLSPRSPAQRKIESADVVYLGTDDDAKEWDEDLGGALAVIESPKRISPRMVRKLGELGAKGVVLLSKSKSDTTVAEAHGPRHERMMRLRLGKHPEEGRAPLIYLSEASSSSLRKALGKATPGAKLKGSMSEHCAISTGTQVLENVVGIWPGSDKALRNEVIILSAHYDHIGVNSDGQINNGADDNGSGTSGLLALTEALAEYGPMRRTIMLQWVSGEEKGLWGSAAWTKNPWLPEGMRAVCNINIDMIGRNAGDELLITPTKKHDEYSWLTKVAEKHRASEGFKKLGSADDYYRRSDHFNYRQNMNIPVIFLFADVHEDYHKPTDTPDKINYDKIERVARLVLRILDDLQRDKLEQ